MRSLTTSLRRSCSVVVLTALTAAASPVVVLASPLAAVGDFPSDVVVSGYGEPPNEHEDLVVVARPHTDRGGAITGGTLSFFVTGSGTPTCVETVGDFFGGYGPWSSCNFGPQTSGPHSVTVQFSGNDLLSPSSRVTSVTVTPDTVKASSVELSYSTFYPVVDGYRDSVSIRGDRGEPIAVTVRVYSAGNALIRTISVPLGTSPYAVAWDGKYTTGTVRPEGTYKVTQTLVDAFGTTKVFTSFVALSKKHLIYRTLTRIRDGENVDEAGGHTGTTDVYSGPFAKLVPLTGDALVGYQFSLPTATVYSYVNFKVYARHVRTTGDQTAIAGQDFTKPYTSSCGSTLQHLWPRACFSGWKAVGNSAGTTGWFTTGNLGSAYRYGKTVRVMVYGTGKVTYVYEVRMTVRYAVLGY